MGFHLKECIETHRHFGTANPSALPTRVLDLDPDTAPSCTIRLVSGSGRLEHYAALSYCWGVPSEANQPFTTTRDTLRSRIEGFDDSQMPATLRDAVVVTRFLGIRYLWIDALCIVQDDDADWAQESAKMARVYEDALITIAAASAKDSHAGFLKDRGIEDRRACAIPYQSGSIYLRPMPTTQKLNFGNAIPQHWRQPIQARAWTFQERVLATRAIFFDQYQLLWECSAGHALESRRPFLRSLTDFDYNFEGFKPFRKLHSALIAGCAPSEKPDSGNDERYLFRKAYYGQWYHILTNYIGRHLTNKEDMLVALSGIAQTMAPILEDEYFAGIWKNDLLRGLLWVSFSVNAGQRLRWAPSWSWAGYACNGSGFNASVIKEDDRINSAGDAKLLEFIAEPRFRDPMGQLLVAKLKISGYCTSLTALPKRVDHPYPLLEWYMDQEYKFKVYVHSVQDLAARLHEPPIAEENVQVFQVLLLGEWEESSKMFPRERKAWGIMLTPNTNGVDEYFREGCISIDLPRGIPAPGQPSNPDISWKKWTRRTITLV